MVIPDTGVERIFDRVTFQHHMVQMPSESPTDGIVHATRNLEHPLCAYPPAMSKTMDAIYMLHTLLNPVAPSQNELPDQPHVPH